MLILPDDQEQLYIPRLDVLDSRSMMDRISLPRVLLLAVGLSSIGLVSAFLEGPLSATSVAMNILSSVILSLFLAWFVSMIDLRRTHLIFLIWTVLFVIMYLNNMIEGYFFTTVFSSLSIFGVGAVMILFVTLIEGVIAGLVLSTPARRDNLIASLRNYLTGRRTGSWAMRIVASSVVYFPIYFFFGAIVAPYVLPYYSDPSFGLVVPPITVIVPLEVFRGFLYVISLLPVIAAIKGDKKTVFTILTATLFVPGALIPLLRAAASLPTPIIPIHLAEILADSIVYGFVLSCILARPSIQSN